MPSVKHTEVISIDDDNDGALVGPPPPPPPPLKTKMKMKTMKKKKQSRMGYEQNNLGVEIDDDGNEVIILNDDDDDDDVIVPLPPQNKKKKKRRIAPEQNQELATAKDQQDEFDKISIANHDRKLAYQLALGQPQRDNKPEIDVDHELAFQLANDHSAHGQPQRDNKPDTGRKWAFGKPQRDNKPEIDVDRELAFQLANDHSATIPIPTPTPTLTQLYDHHGSYHKSPSFTSPLPNHRLSFHPVTNKKKAAISNADNKKIIQLLLPEITQKVKDIATQHKHNPNTNPAFRYVTPLRKKYYEPVGNFMIKFWDELKDVTDISNHLFDNNHTMLYLKNVCVYENAQDRGNYPVSEENAFGQKFDGMNGWGCQVLQHLIEFMNNSSQITNILNK